MWFSLTFFIHKEAFWYFAYGPIKIKSYTFFFIIIDLMMLDHTNQLEKLISFLHLALVFAEFEFLTILGRYFTVLLVEEGFF